MLAAGRGERFLAAGASVHKLHALLGDRSVLAHTVAAARASGLGVHVVHPHEDIVTMGDAICAGVQATPHAGGWLLLPADLPLVQSATIQAVANGLQSGVAQAVRPSVDGLQGHPVAFGASLRTALLDCKGKPGAASVFKRCVATLLVVSDRGCITDVDTPTDLRRCTDLVRSRCRS